MTTHTERRWGAILFSGGLLLTIAYLLYPSSAHSGLIRPAAVLGLLGVALTLPGVVAFQWVQSSRARVTGGLGMALVVLGIGFLEIPHLIFGAFDPAKLYNLDAYHSGTYGAMAFYGLVMLGAGLILLSIATWRAGVYPRLAAWLVIVNLCVSMVYPVGSVDAAVAAPAPSYLLVAMLGLTMIRQGARKATATQRLISSQSVATTGVA
jgi:hypothetical protein